MSAITIKRKFNDVRTGFQPMQEVRLDDLSNIPELTIKDIVPSEYLKGDYIHDTALAMTILCAEGIATEWELEQVAIWAEKQDRRVLYDIARSCKKMALEYKIKRRKHHD